MVEVVELVKKGGSISPSRFIFRINQFKLFNYFNQFAQKVL